MFAATSAAAVVDDRVSGSPAFAADTIRAVCSLPFLALRPYPANLMRFTRNRQFSLKFLRKVGPQLCRTALGLSNLTLNYAIHFAQLSSCSFGFPVPTLSSSLDPLIPISCFSHKTEPSMLCHAPPLYSAFPFHPLSLQLAKNGPF